jgi:pyrimidine operon attenuation protein/uracil phosphoribosyltransferase
MSLVMRPDQVAATIKRLAHEIDERNLDGYSLLFLGVRNGGVPLAHRIVQHLRVISDRTVEVGALDISGHRDDRRRTNEVGASEIPSEINGSRVILVDDVIYTGRTIRAALDAVVDHGRPAQVQVAVLVDRGHREVPIKPDYVGKNLPTSRGERVLVRLDELNGSDGVYIETLVAQ